jgi:hypothetical protein
MLQLNPTIKVGKEWEKLTRDTQCHVDPDIFESVLPRKVGWKACFGQIAAAQCHWRNQCVGVGDVFLFFGWFQKTKAAKDCIAFDAEAQHQHIIFGYLQIGQVIHQDDDVEIPDWMRAHPHFGYDDSTNTIYVAREKLSWNEKCPGAGTFSFHKELVLTKEGLQFSRSQWGFARNLQKNKHLLP